MITSGLGTTVCSILRYLGIQKKSYELLNAIPTPALPGVS